MNTNDNNGNISRNSNKDAEDKVDKQKASIPELSFTFRKKDNPLKSIRFYMNGCYIVQGVYETGTIKDGTLTFEKSKGSPVKVERHKISFIYREEKGSKYRTKCLGTYELQKPIRVNDFLVRRWIFSSSYPPLHLSLCFVVLCRVIHTMA